MIKLGNMRNYNYINAEVTIRIDRANKILGNRFIMHNESERNYVCDKYEEWLRKEVANKNALVLNELKRIYNGMLTANKQNKDLVLLCWCYPKRCHGESIIKILKEIYNF